MELLEKAPKMNSFDASIVLYDMYEMNYDIYAHSNTKKRPLSSVALHETEDNTLTSSLYEAITGYHQRGIKELFGLSLKEYLDLPSEICILLMETSSKDAATKNNIISQMDRDINGRIPKK